MNRLASLFVVGVVLVAALLLAGCAAREVVHPISNYVVPDYSARAIKSIALMPISERAMCSEATETIPRSLRQHASAKTSYRFLSVEDVVNLARAENASEPYNELISVWQKKAEVATQNAISVGQAAGVDALLFTDVYICLREWIEPNARGSSQTQVGIRLLLISAKNGEKLWEASDEQVAKSVEYDPSSKIGVHVDEFGRATALYGGIPNPPTFEEVVPLAFDALFKVFP